MRESHSGWRARLGQLARQGVSQRQRVLVGDGETVGLSNVAVMHPSSDCVMAVDTGFSPLFFFFLWEGVMDRREAANLEASEAKSVLRFLQMAFCGGDLSEAGD